MLKIKVNGNNNIISKVNLNNVLGKAKVKFNYIINAVVNK